MLQSGIPIIDITEINEQAEAARRRANISDALYRDIVESSADLVLRIAADGIRFGQPPTPGEVLAKAKACDDSFKSWTPKAISTHLKRYGLATNKSHGRKVYGKVTVEDLRRIQTTYAVDLGLDDREEI